MKKYYLKLNLLIYIILISSISISFSQNTCYTIKIDPITKRIDTTFAPCPNCIDYKLARLVYMHPNIFNNLRPISNSLYFEMLLPVPLYFYGKTSNMYYDKNTAYLMGISEGFTFLFNTILKNLIRRDRPCSEMKNVKNWESIKTDSFSFPSGHSSSASAITTMLVLRYPNKPGLYIPMIIWSLSVGYSRMVRGMHYFTDVLGGFTLGFLTSYATFAERKWLIDLKNRNFVGENRPDQKSDATYVGSWALFLFSVSFVEEFFINQNQINIGVRENYLNSPEIQFKLNF